MAWPESKETPTVLSFQYGNRWSLFSRKHTAAHSRQTNNNNVPKLQEYLLRWSRVVVSFRYCLFPPKVPPTSHPMQR